MKIGLVIYEGEQQIMFAPENDTEKAVLKLITPSKKILVEPKVKHGPFYDSEVRANGYGISYTVGGYMRAFSEPDCLMLVLREEKKDVCNQEKI